MSLLCNIPDDVNRASLSTEMFNEVVKAIVDAIIDGDESFTYKVNEDIIRDKKLPNRKVSYGGVTYLEDKSLQTRVISYWKEESNDE